LETISAWSGMYFWGLGFSSETDVLLVISVTASCHCRRWDENWSVVFTELTYLQVISILFLLVSF